MNTSQQPSDPNKDDVSPETVGGMDIHQVIVDLVRESEKQSSDSAVRKMSADVSRATTELVTRAENAERVRGLTFEELSLDPNNPTESPALRELKELYRKNLLSDEAIRGVLAGDETLYIQEMELGRMMNNLSPSPRERAEYQRRYKGTAYESVQEQMVQDMLHHPDRNGDYMVFALRDPATGVLVASVSIRVPPPGNRNDSDFQKYSFAMSSFLSRFTFRPAVVDERQVFDNIGTTAEIDTVNADPAFPGAGTRLMHDLAVALAEKGKLPQNLAYYRCTGLRGYQGGSNMASAVFFNKLGFTEIADRCDELDWLVREVSPEEQLFVEQPTWALGYSPAKSFLKRVQQRATQKRLITGPSKIVLP